MSTTYRLQAHTTFTDSMDSTDEDNILAIPMSVTGTPEGRTLVTVCSNNKSSTKRKGKAEKINAKVNTIDTEFKFCIHSSTTGRQLFDQVAQLLKLKHVWFFGLQYTDTKGYPTWLKLKKKVFSQEMGRKRPVQLHFRAKFYPEDVGKELLDPATLKQFYLQTREDIISGKIYCPVDTAVLLASFAVQIQNGDYQESVHKPGFLHNEILLPQKLLQQYELGEQEWEDKIVSFYKDHHGTDQQSGMMEFMKVAQDLEMFGINYFTIKNKKGTELLLGVDSLGLNVYEKTNKLTPKLGFPWSEIKSISFSDKKFTIKPVDESAPHFIFFAHRVRINKRILALCMGNHELYVRRRRSSTGSPSPETTSPSIPHSMPSPATKMDSPNTAQPAGMNLDPIQIPTIVTTVPTPCASPPCSNSPTEDLPDECAAPTPAKCEASVCSMPSSSQGSPISGGEKTASSLSDEHSFHPNDDDSSQEPHIYEATEPSTSFESEQRPHSSMESPYDSINGDNITTPSNGTVAMDDLDNGDDADEAEDEKSNLQNSKRPLYGSTVDITNDGPDTITPSVTGSPNPHSKSNGSTAPSSPHKEYVPSSQVPKGTYVCNVMVGEEIDERKYEMKVADYSEGEEEEEKGTKEYTATLKWEPQVKKEDETDAAEEDYADRDLHTKKNKNTYRKLVRLFEDLNKDAKAAGPGSAEDRLMQEIRDEGMDKYKTLRGIRRGNTKDRVAVFEAL